MLVAVLNQKFVIVEASWQPASEKKDYLKGELARVVMKKRWLFPTIVKLHIKYQC
jgi:hypothetical protein